MNSQCDDEYLTPIEGLWRWSSDAEVVMWSQLNLAASTPRSATLAAGQLESDGSDTVELVWVTSPVFTTQISLVLPFAPSVNTLPSLTACLFVLEACVNALNRQQLLHRLNTLAATAGVTSRSEWLAAWLEKIGQLPAEYRQGIQAQRDLLSCLAAQVPHKLLYPATIALIERMQASLDGTAVMPSSRSDTYRSLSDARIAWMTLHAFKTFDITPKNIEVFRDTGFDKVPTEVVEDFQLPKSTPQSYSVWLKSLTQFDNQEVSTVARMALEATGLLSIPRPLHLPDVLPAGGVSDIANRGLPHQLLITELAQDDLVLLTRLALSQALYVRREVPPDQSSLERLVLVESGIRVWGQSRLLLTAIAMAANAQGLSQHVETYCFAAESTKLIPLDLNSLEGIKKRLEHLSLDVHPGPALEAFQREILERETKCEPLLIVARETAHDPEFRQAFTKLPGSCLVAEVQATGEFQLSRWTKAGCDRLQAGKLDATLKAAIKKPILVDSLPAFMHHKVAPVRMTPVSPETDYYTYKNIAYCVTRDRRLLKWTTAGIGGIELDSNLPSRDVWLWSHQEPETIVLSGYVELIVGSEKSGFYLYRVSVNENRCYAIKLNGIDDSVEGFFWTAEHYLIVVGKRTLQRISVDTGERVGDPTSRAGTDWLGGNLFALGDRGRYATWERKLELRPLPFGNQLSLLRSNAIIPTKFQGPVFLRSYDMKGFLTTGEELLLAKRCTFITNNILRIERVSSDLQRVLLAPVRAAPMSTPFSQCPQKMWLVDMDESAVIDASPKNCWAWLEPLANNLIQSRGFRCRFSAVSAMDGRIAVCGKGLHWFSIFHNNTMTGGRWFEPVAKPEEPVQFQQHDTKYGFTLHRAQWSDGRVAWLDSRGLLHLHDSQQPHDVSLVLGANQVSGWKSTGVRWGDRYHTTFDQSTMPIEVKVWLAKFARSIS